MKNASRKVFGGMFVIAVISWVSICTTGAAGQTAGNNAVYNSSGNCSGSTCGFSAAFIDASLFGGSGTNVCGVLYGILSATSYPYPSMGAVIDARGLPKAGSSMTCPATQPSPWYGITSPPPSTILLPAGVISIPSVWILPNNTHLIGEGDGVASGSSTTVNTTIEASTSFTASPGNMIQFGSSTVCSSTCSGISVEKLILAGQGQSINGIVNAYAQDNSYVDHVSLYQIRGTGLLVESNATNSGPYTNISFDTSTTYSGTSSTVCAQILSVSGGTRGIHGLNCRTYNNDPNGAVLLDSSNNSIEDVSIEGFDNGVLVGYNATAKDNVLLNIVGATNQGASLAPIYVVSISNNYTVSDLSVIGVVNQGTGSGQYTIWDSVTSTRLSDSSVGVYALGNDSDSAGYYSRFTTSSNAPSWVAGPLAPSGSCAQGSLYSCNGTYSGCSNYALWACAYNSHNVLGWLSVQ